MGNLNVPKGSHVVNPLVSTSDARKLIEFLELVFGDDPTMAYIHDSLVDALEKISKIE